MSPRPPPPPPPTSAAALRKLLADAQATGSCLQMPCVYDGLTARLVERAGFPLTFMTGYGVSAVHGLPDTQLISYAEMQQSARLVTESLTRIPCFGDGDTGYGSAANVERTVRGYAAAGLAGIMIEDQVSPKKCGHTKGKDVVPFEDAVARVRAAVLARDRLIAERNPPPAGAGAGAGAAAAAVAAAGRVGATGASSPEQRDKDDDGDDEADELAHLHLPGDLVIIARTDARGVLGMDEALRRLQAFRAIEGFRPTDMTFLEAPESEEEMARYGREVPGPKLANCLEKGLTPILPPERLAALGYTVAAYPLSLLAASIAAMDAVLAKLANGEPLPVDANDNDGGGGGESGADRRGVLSSFRRTCEAVGFDEYYERVQTFGE